MAVKPNFYKQTDRRWANVSGNGATIARNGCGPTSLANILSVLKNPKITPVDTFKWLVKNKYIYGTTGTYWAGITAALKHFGITKFKVTNNSSEALKSLKSGKWMISTVAKSRWTNGGHFIVVYGINNGKCLISDSASNSDYRQKNGPWSEYAKAERQQWISIDPKDYSISKPKTTSKEYILYVSSSKTNIRMGRGDKYKAVGVVKRGRKLLLYSYKSGWYRIKEGKYKGYFINEKTLSKYKPHVATYKLLVTMNLRSGYTTKSDVLRVVKQGSVVKSSKLKGNWIYVPALKGWLCIKDKLHVYLKETK